MSSIPPPGYDDPTVVPRTRFTNTANKISGLLEMFQENIPIEKKAELENDFEVLYTTADELHIAHLEAVQKVFDEYRRFLSEPSRGVEVLRQEIENLKLYI